MNNIEHNDDGDFDNAWLQFASAHVNNRMVREERKEFTHSLREKSKTKQ